MIGLLCFVLAVLASPFKSKLRLEAENAVLRHQLNVVRRRLPGRVRLTNNDRWFFIQLYRWFPSILQVLTIIRPRHSCVGTGPAFAYMRRRESRGFFVIKHSLLPFKRLTRAQACIDGTDGPLLGRDERSTPGARRGAPGREGLTAKARAKPQWCQAITPQM